MLYGREDTRGHNLGISIGAHFLLGRESNLLIVVCHRCSNGAEDWDGGIIVSAIHDQS